MTRSGLRMLLDQQGQTIADLERQLAAATKASATLEQRAVEVLSAKDEENAGLRGVITQQDETLQELYTEFNNVKREIEATNTDFLRQMADLNAEFTATIEERDRQILARDRHIQALTDRIRELEKAAPAAAAEAPAEKEAEAPAPPKRRVYGKKAAAAEKPE